MDQQRIDELKRLCEAATPGPWAGSDHRNFKDILDHKVVLCTNVPEEDAAFISAARTALPELIEEVERLRTTLEMYANENNWAYYDDAHWCGGMSDRAFGWEPAQKALQRTGEKL